jgi:putative acetyltransferase
VIVRGENPEDREQVRIVNEAAFGRTDEANLVDALRDEAAVLASLVAEIDGHVVAHILFSRMWIETAGERIPAVALAPVAVLPEHQRRGIAGKLIERGLDLLRSEGERIVIVLGEPEYYSRFGFSTQKACDLASPFPPEAYMALELHARALDGVRGKVRYSAAFGIRE